ncbi:MAG TPA: uracil-DNA glycosylase [Planctomycetota bacterium]|nr:uracil-DNA glycosylase [Planctomycetota bacterium]
MSTRSAPQPQRHYDTRQRRGFSNEPSLPAIPSAPPIPADDAFLDLRSQVSQCTNCDLCKARTNTVFGEGDPNTDLVFVGEGPGEDEDRLGRPFVGRAGKLLTKIIHDGMKLHRHKIYICNVVKCRPPQNRVPTINEMLVCRRYLFQQLQTIHPKVIVGMGATAVHGLLGEKVAITKYRGIFRDWEGMKLMPTFHPSYLLRNYTQEARAAVWEDMKQVLQLLKEQGSGLVG